jgi:hypothetical protein
MNTGRGRNADFSNVVYVVAAMLSRNTILLAYLNDI